MKLLLTVFFAFALGYVARGEDITTLSGTTYRNARVSKVEADGVVLFSTAGWTKVSFRELPRAIQERLGRKLPPADSIVLFALVTEATPTSCVMVPYERHSGGNVGDGGGPRYSFKTLGSKYVYVEGLAGAAEGQKVNVRVKPAGTVTLAGSRTFEKYTFISVEQ